MAVAFLAAAMAFPPLCLADEPGDSEAVRRFSEHPPPRIPHDIGGGFNAEDCLVCHREGLKNAPRSPHPVRLDCTQCHLPGSTGDSQPADKKDKAR
jgi:cytochrome c-type protein NapB